MARAGDGAALEAVRADGEPDLSPVQRHRRVVYAVAEPDADRAHLRQEIRAMPGCFAGYDTEIIFISQEEMARDHSGLPHGRCVIRTGIPVPPGSTSSGWRQVCVLAQIRNLRDVCWLPVPVPSLALSAFRINLSPPSPQPPSPLGKGAIFVIFCKGLRPLHPCDCAGAGLVAGQFPVPSDTPGTVPLSCPKVSATCRGRAAQKVIRGHCRVNPQFPCIFCRNML